MTHGKAFGMIPAAIGTAFVGAMIATSMSPKARRENQEFVATLDTRQKEEYEKIIRRRMTIFIWASIIALVVGLVAVMLFVKGYKTKKQRNANAMIAGGLFLAAAFATQYFVYVLWPKGHLMVEYLYSSKQVREWTDVYQHMQFIYHIGMVAGLIGYFLIGTGIAMLMRQKQRK